MREKKKAASFGEKENREVPGGSWAVLNDAENKRTSEKVGDCGLTGQSWWLAGVWNNFEGRAGFLGFLKWKEKGRRLWVGIMKTAELVGNFGWITVKQRRVTGVWEKAVWEKKV